MTNPKSADLPRELIGAGRPAIFAGCTNSLNIVFNLAQRAFRGFWGYFFSLFQRKPIASHSSPHAAQFASATAAGFFFGDGNRIGFARFTP